jgi:hypothetical protein
MAFKQPSITVKVPFSEANNFLRANAGTGTLGDGRFEKFWRNLPKEVVSHGLIFVVICRSHLTQKLFRCTLMTYGSTSIAFWTGMASGKLERYS